ncbi:BTAD domain-containing putative transcriptional regulator [Streptomyces sp. NBC_00503]|uniref:BTAD domain-containing putative transcriptional regulator n=1 Tax=Streptomyces sp. NBC_00503 TaxID=2903659 RepID=UPI002E81A2E5|nr:BTAD domain-containing putative transcriptional regulator [Streptomyces sp. NBC_00503]WUD84022.1 AAA family ATPase [Streptomyces sp. NBC_00503]
MVYIRVLGSFAAERDGEPVPLGGHRQRSVLALLVSARGRVVSVDRMIEELWQGAAPARAVASLQAYVSNLRRLLEPGRAPRTAARLLVSTPPGYALRLPGDAVDAWRFEQLLGEARELLAGGGTAGPATAPGPGPATVRAAGPDIATVRAADPAAARALLREALGLWQGPAYAESADEPWSHTEILRLDELRLAARELDIVAGLRGRDPARVVADAALLTREEPLREEAWRLHALALWAAGRQADALAALRRARTVLADEVGLDPGAALVELEQAVLAQDDRLLREATAGPSATPDAAGTGVVVPAVRAAERAPGAEPEGGAGLFVGRAAELALLAEASGRALAAGPAVALVTGEAGLGKSALLHRLGERLRREGWLVALGRAGEAEGAPPAWAWAEALRTVAAAIPPGPGAAAALTPLLGGGATGGGPAGGGPAGSGPDGSGPVGGAGLPREDVAAGRFRLHRAVWEWLGSAAGQRPVAVVLDDLHGADAETLALLTGVAELPAGTPVLVVGAYRPDEVGDRLADTLAVLARSSPARIALHGLDEAAVAEVVRAAAGPGVAPETVAALTERTGGNPFYVRESARLLAGEGALVALSDVPEGVRDVLRRRLGRLPDPVVAVLRLAAVAGRESEVEVLVGAADTDEDGVLGALEAGLLTGLLVEPGPGRIRFAHALVRDTLLADLSRLRATRMHARIGAVLERLGPDEVSALAHHFVRAASSATAVRAVRYCLRAAELAEARYAHEAAAALLSEALESFERIPADRGSGADERGDGDGGGEAGGGSTGRTTDRNAERADLLGRLVRAQVRAGAVVAARGTRRRAIDHAVGANREDLLIRAFTAWTEPTPWQTRPYGTVDRPVVALLERLLARPDHEPAVRCRLLIAYATELSDARLPAVRAAAREAVELAEGLARPALRAAALAALVRELDADLEWPERATLGRELEDLGTAHDLPAHRWYGLFIRSTAAAATGDVAAVRRLVGEYTEFARTYRMPGPAVVGEGVRATLAHIGGRTEDAERMYAEAAAAMSRQGSPHAAGHLAIATATLLASRGLMGRSVAWARQVHEGFGPLAADLLAVALAEAGEAAQAREVLAEAGPLPANYLFKVLGTFRAMTLVALGEKQGARELYEALLPYADAPPPSSGFTVAMRPVAYTLGELAVLLGDESGAASHFARSESIAARWNSPWGRRAPAPPTAAVADSRGWGPGGSTPDSDGPNWL